jgi:hypothetical protein
MISTVSGCLSATKYYVGDTSKEQNRLMLEQGGPHSGAWSTNDIKIDYQYSRKDDQLQLKGEMVLDNSLKYNYEYISRLMVTVSFIDQEGTVLESGIVMNRTGLTTDYYTFEQAYTLPSETSGMAFAYQGRVVEAGGPVHSGGGAWNLYKRP